MRAEQALVADLDSGLALDEVARRHWRRFYYSEAVFLEALSDLCSSEMGPFRQAADARARHAPQSIATPMMRSVLAGAWGALPLMAGRIGGVPVLFARPPSELRMPRAPATRHVSGRFGIADNAWRDGACESVCFRVEGEPLTGARRMLFERVLHPRSAERDRGFQDLELDLPDAACELLRFTTSTVLPHDGRADWAFWTELELHWVAGRNSACGARSPARSAVAARHETHLAARVLREVRNEPRTGCKGG